MQNFTPLVPSQRDCEFSSNTELVAYEAKELRTALARAMLLAAHEGGVDGIKLDESDGGRRGPRVLCVATEKRLAKVLRRAPAAGDEQSGGGPTGATHRK